MSIPYTDIVIWVIVSIPYGYSSISSSRAGWLDELGSWTLLERLHKINNDDETPFQEVVHSVMSLYITMTYYQ